MQGEKHLEIVKDLACREFGKGLQDISPLQQCGSDREYYRVSTGGKTVVGVFSSNTEENDAFVYLSGHLGSKDLPVPSVFAYYRSEGVYFQTDLGSVSLYNHVLKARAGKDATATILSVYKAVIDRLVDFQAMGIEGLDTQKCYPYPAFDSRSMTWDMNYFKYMFLNLLSVSYNEARLEEDFKYIVKKLEAAGSMFFLYRDFQSANIMLKDGCPWFIDYQGGRAGAPQYDLASLLYDSKALHTREERSTLYDYYLNRFTAETGYSTARFSDCYPYFILVRLMQALGAYGYRGVHQGKPGFKESIRPAVKDLREISQDYFNRSELPELFSLIDRLQDINI